jgi:hypothetical protein
MARAKDRDQQEALYKIYKCRSNACESESLGAATPMEAAWLKSRGFPTQDREDQLNGMSMNDLEQAANSGELAAQAVLGRRMMEQGRESEGFERLLNASASGSVYADYQLSQAESKRNRLESAAYLRRAYLQGDKKAALAMYKSFSDYGPADWAQVDEEAMTLYSGLLTQRANKGRMQYGPRP